GLGAWYKLASVTLANGDNVGVVEPWRHPDETGEITPEMAAARAKAEALFLELLRRHKGPVSSSKNSQHYAPKLFEKNPLAKAACVTKADLAAALDRLLADGRVYVGSGKTPRGPREERMA